MSEPDERIDASLEADDEYQDARDREAHELEVEVREDQEELDDCELGGNG